MNIETVNELIRSLESEGELSIREQKFLKLAKEFRICSASLDAAIKTGNMLAEQNAQLAAENVALKSYRYTLDEIKNSLVGGGHGHMAKAEMQAQGAVLDVIFDTFDDIETPATDANLAGIKADGVEEWVSSRGGRWNGTTEEALKFAKQLREGKSEEVKS
ncbi:hypothetical protein HB813_19885 [Klebsiella pneumoniae]|uniref:hypothetical protein n=1 Tax=Klebsiella pneumoniae TaxID=573 RepID=UPI0014279051|nr:hypothetical protein [Klebsiella pneumoniae]QIR56839.1 hypothetical protein HB813_19885 [Klebsiella pneumoniae]HBW4183925.1 hypothetical protein [Klebsiella pneumoniae]HCT1995584.1 hypothetical protein [Klebsiella pneumoniae]HCT2611001.1 hypothetical protein [Klebsiella pneumoniae]